MPRQNNRLYSFLALGLMTLVSACMDPSVSNDGTEETAQTTEGASTQQPSDPISSGEPASSDVTLALNGSGLQLTGANAEGSKGVTFGEGIDDATEVASLVLGQPAPPQVNNECGAGPIEFTSWDNGFALHAMNGELVGWSLRSRDVTGTQLFTDKGIGIGRSRSELESAYSTTIEESTLGTEFAADDALFGILSSDAPDATIDYMWAGTSCNFR
ncbi:MAG: hypothetical protein WA949_11050 [Phormidesmis sp.]